MLVDLYSEFLPFYSLSVNPFFPLRSFKRGEEWISGIIHEFAARKVENYYIQVQSFANSCIWITESPICAGKFSNSNCIVYFVLLAKKNGMDLLI